jgi:hypothetical protein
MDRSTPDFPNAFLDTLAYLSVLKIRLMPTRMNLVAGKLTFTSSYHWLHDLTDLNHVQGTVNNFSDIQYSL